MLNVTLQNTEVLRYTGAIWNSQSETSIVDT